MRTKTFWRCFSSTCNLINSRLLCFRRRLFHCLRHLRKFLLWDPFPLSHHFRSQNAPWVPLEIMPHFIRLGHSISREFRLQDHYKLRSNGYSPIGHFNNALDTVCRTEAPVHESFWICALPQCNQAFVLWIIYGLYFYNCLYPRCLLIHLAFDRVRSIRNSPVELYYPSAQSTSKYVSNLQWLFHFILWVNIVVHEFTSKLDKFVLQGSGLLQSDELVHNSIKRQDRCPPFRTCVVTIANIDWASVQFFLANN